MTAIDGAELDALVDYWRCANYLTVAQIYLQANPLLREPLPRRAHQAPAARALGNVARAEPRVRAAQPADPADGRGRGLHRRARSRRPGARREHLPRGHLLRAVSPRSRPTSPACVRLVRQFSTPGGIPSHVERARHRARSTRAASSATRSSTRSAPPSTTPTCWSPASSATARPRPDRSPGRGRAIRYLHPARDGAVLPILHLNGYKIASATVLGRRERRGGRRAPARRGVRAADRRRRRPARGPSPVRRGARRAATRGSARSRRTRARPALPSSSARRRGPRSCCARPRAGRVPTSSTACRSRGRSAPTRCRSRTCGRIPSTSRCSRTWLRSYAPERHFDERGRLVPELAALAPRGRQAHGIEPVRQRGQADAPARPAADRRLRDRRRGARGRSWPSRRAGSARCCATSTAGTRPASGSSARTRRPRTGCSDVFDASNRCLVDADPRDRRPPVARTAA